MKKLITPERNGKRMEYKATLNGELIGYFRTHQAAREELDRLAFEQLKRG